MVPNRRSAPSRASARYRPAGRLQVSCRRPHDQGIYDSDLAHARARERAPSPQRPAAGQAIYHGGKGGLSRQLTRKLRTGRPLRKRRRTPWQRQTRFIAPAPLIDQRPGQAADRDRIGDWEGDLIIGRGSRSAIGTLVGRHSRYLRLLHLPASHDARALHAEPARVLAVLPATARLTLTWDQGSEMAPHDQIAPLLRDGVFFARPASPWQRGTNENTNGLLRQYFPKGSDLSVHTASDLKAVEERLNTRPRKTLGWRTPAEIFTAALSS